MTSIPRSTRRRSHDDRGSSLISTVAGVTVVLAFLLFSAQLLVSLHARTVVASAATSGARKVAAARIDHTDPAALEVMIAAAEVDVRRLLGPVGDRARLDWSGTDAAAVVLRVEVDSPRLSLPAFGGTLATDHIERTAVATVERVG